MTTAVVSGRLGPLLVLFLTIGVFAGTVFERRAALGVLSYGHHEWLTAHALKFARVWWHEGAYSLDFLMIETPRDVEHPDLNSRAVYPSYPPGAVLAPYAIARILNIEPGVRFLMIYNLGLHLLIALCLSAAVWFWLSFQSPAPRLAASTFPGISYLLLPGPMYWQQNVYFTDTAVIAPMAVLLLVLAYEANERSMLTVLATTLALAWGLATDWLFVSVAFVYVVMQGFESLYPRQSVTQLPQRLAPVMAAAASVFGFYAWQLTGHDLWSKWQQKLSLRTYGDGDGADLMSSNFNQTVWGTFSRDQYGHLGTALIFFSAIFAVFYIYEANRLRRSTLTTEVWTTQRASFIAVLTLSPILHTYLLKNHSYLHDFSVLKFALPLSCVPFAVLPAVASRIVGKPSAYRHWLIPLAALIVGLVYVLVLHRRYPGMVPTRNPEIAQMGSFINKSTSYDDVVFSSCAKAEPYPSEPHLLSHSLKLIHKVDGLGQLRDWAQGLPSAANVVWFGTTEREQEPPGGNGVWATAARTSEGSLYLLRLPRGVFLTRANQEMQQ